jgi:hypothetical protein
VVTPSASVSAACGLADCSSERADTGAARSSAAIRSVAEGRVGRYLMMRLLEFNLD